LVCIIPHIDTGIVTSRNNVISIWRECCSNLTWTSQPWCRKKEGMLT
jgi:hypothetical protein